MMEFSPDLRPVPRSQVSLLLVAALAMSLVIVSPPLHPVPLFSGSGVKTLAAAAADGYGSLPISFEPNVGQAPGRFDFVARGHGFGIAISSTGATLAPGGKDLVGVNLLGASHSATARTLDPLA